jgi:hypothetical protein
MEKENINKKEPVKLKKQTKNKKVNTDAFKYQELDLSVYGRHVIGFRSLFNEYLEDIEIYAIRNN